jgi:predicted GNAT family acetyltransferase
MARPGRSRRDNLDQRVSHSPPPEVRDNPAQSRFEFIADDGTAAAYYDLSPGVITFIHTEVPRALEGRGIGAQLARGALEAVRARGLKVVAECPFIRGYIERHPEFQDLLR